MAQSQTSEHSSMVCSKNSLRSVSKRHSVGGTVSGQGEHFHPYLRQFSDGTGAVQPQSPSFSCGLEVCSPESVSWVSNNSVQAFYPEVPAITPETSHFISPDCPSFTSLNNHSEVSSKPYSTVNQCHSSKYSLVNFSSTASQESCSQSLFPKPIYSYSILIFMALRNSKTGSLPVSEIYSFMTEHFPYFKTAPDGWKNSVRHNLSLNKCFEKVENKNGNSSRKGCLWTLNPAKVDKMQEELHKWRRKDPGTVRRSMAKPEDLDRLLGDKPDKVRSLSLYNTISSRLHTYATSSCNASEQPRPPCPFSGHYPQSLHLAPSVPHPSHSFSLYSPLRQQPLAPHSLDSPVAEKMPPAYCVTLHDGHSGSHSRSMQDLLLDGDAECDIDALNPSLTDLQLQGNLWEELKEDSAASDPRAVPTLSPRTSATSVESTSDQSSYLQSSVTPTPEWMLVRDKVQYEDKDTERLWGLEQYSYLNGRNLGVYSGVESLAGCLSPCTTSVSLM